jgi:hypothetical protein
MIKEFATNPKSWNESDKHSPFEGKYAEQMVDAIIERDFKNRPAYKNGYGPSPDVKAKIAQRAIACYRRYVDRGIWFAPATVATAAADYVRLQEREAMKQTEQRS